MARWLEKLQEYHLNIVHRPGRKHANADSLSRRPCEQCGMAEAVSPISIDASPIGDRSLVKLRELQKEDPNLKFVLEARETGQRPTADAVKS